MEVGPPTLAVLSVTNRSVVASGVRRATIEARAGISHNRLAVILRGDRPMTVDELVRICEAIGVSAAAVLREAEEMLSTAPPALPADALGVFVRWVPLPEGRRGAWHAGSGTIWLAEGMGESAAVAALLHEVEHARRGDECPQPGWVERRIDRTVACRLIRPDEYARAERVSGGRGSGAVAVELGLPRWVVRAFRDTMREV